MEHRVDYRYWIVDLVLLVDERRKAQGRKYCSFFVGTVTPLGESSVWVRC